MSYEQNCDDYALYGDPERDHWDHEEAARYDRWDGHRGCEDDLSSEYDYDDCCPHTGRPGVCDCPDCQASAETLSCMDLVDLIRREVRDDDVPF